MAIRSRSIQYSGTEAKSLMLAKLGGAPQSLGPLSESKKNNAAPKAAIPVAQRTPRQPSTGAMRAENMGARMKAALGPIS